MPERTSAQIPDYRVLKPTGRGVVCLIGRDIYLGAHGTPWSKERLRQVIGEWLANSRQLVARRALVESPQAASVAELLLAYLEFAKGYCVKNGPPKREQGDGDAVLCQNQHARDCPERHSHPVGHGQSAKPQGCPGPSAPLRLLLLAAADVVNSRKTRRNSEVSRDL